MHIGEWEVALGDLNADGIQDVIAGDHWYDLIPPPHRVHPGAAFVFHGPLPAGSVIDHTMADLTVIGRYDDPFGFASVGYTFAAGDVSGDCIDDLIFGIATAPDFRPWAGEVNAVFSPPAAPKRPCSAKFAGAAHP